MSDWVCKNGVFHVCISQESNKISKFVEFAHVAFTTNYAQHTTLMRLKISDVMGVVGG